MPINTTFNLILLVLILGIVNTALGVYNLMFGAYSEGFIQTVSGVMATVFSAFILKPREHKEAPE